MTNQQSHDLPALLRAVNTARSDVEAARRTRAAPGTVPAAAEQRLLLEALERYVDGLAQHGQPVPYRLRDEMALYRSMFNIRRSV
jgi:hypothetical protein